MALVMPVLETERLLIRPFAEADLQDVAESFADVTGDPLQGADVQAAWLHRWIQWAALNHTVLAELSQPPYGDRAIVLRATGRVIGACGLVPSFGPFGQLPSGDPSGPALNTPEIGLFYHLHPSHRRQGLATEAAGALVSFAFHNLGARRIVATTDDDNEASIGVMRNLGMRIERNPFPDPPWFQVVGILDHPES